MATSLLDATRFLYTGPDAVQTGLDPGTIDEERVAVLRGRVLERGGGAIRGVRVFVLGHPEFGETRTREDGFYDLVVNGGGQLTVRFLHDDFLEAQRTLPVAWSNYSVLEDVLLVRQDSRVTPIDLAAPSVQVARGSVMTDASGSRQATLLFPPGNSAEMVLPGGSRQPLGSFRLRATEYTVGPDGPEAMPAALPPTSAYTYAVELGVEEAAAAGAIHVAFGSPVPFYVENFLGVPVGGVVPVGSYDRERGVWVPQEDGLVLRILSIAGGLAELDIEGSGVPAAPDQLADLGVTDAERRELANLYAPGQSVWRVPIGQFSPLDCNFLRWLEPDAEPPDVGYPDGDAISSDPCCAEGSIIEIENQVLGESVPLVGTPFSLNYRSNRSPGRRNVIRLRVSGAAIPASLRRIEVAISVAGRSFRQSLPPEANRVIEVEWDGLDAYGRSVQGTQDVSADVAYVYPLQYRIRIGGVFTRRDCARNFGAYFTTCDGSTAILARPGIDFKRSRNMTFSTTVVSPWDARGHGKLGGWTLDVHHSYDVAGKTLRLGSGTQLDRSASPVLLDLQGEALAELKADISDIAVGPDGSLYLADFDAGQVLRIPPQGAPRLYAGFQGPDDDPPEIPGDIEPVSVAVGPDGSVYLAEFGAIWKVVEGSLVRFAGAENPASSDLGLGFPAVDANLELDADNRSLAVGPDQTVYFTTGDRLLSVGTDGILRLVAGGDSLGSGDGILASESSAVDWSGVTVGADGSIYVAVGPEHRVRRIAPDGIISTVAGGTQGFSGDGGPAVDCALDFPLDVALHPEGGFLVADSGNFRIRLVGQDGVIRTLAGNGGEELAGGGRPPAAEGLSRISSVAVGPDGSILVACFYGDFLSGVAKILRVRPQPPTPTATAGDLLVAGADGAEVYEFDPDGRHLRTWDSLTAAMLYEFTYDAAGGLAEVRDSFNNVTSIRRDAEGRAEAIVAPHGQETLLSHDANGFLASVANPAMDTTRMAYEGETGLLTQFTDPRGNVHRFAYDSYGRLTRDEDPAGEATLLARTTFQGGHEVLLTSPEGRTQSVRVESLPEGGRKVTETTAGTIRTVTVVAPDGTTTRTLPDGRVITETLGPDPRWQMQAPLVTERVETSPSGRVIVSTSEREVELLEATNPLSLIREEDRFTRNGDRTERVFDSSTRTLVTTTPEGRTETTVLNEFGRPVRVQSGTLEELRFAYDARGRLVSAEKGTGGDVRRTTRAYDAAGNLAEIIDPLQRKFVFSYDIAGRKVGVVGPDGEEVRFVPDRAGNLAELVPPNRPPHRLLYDVNNLEREYQPPAVANGGPTAQFRDGDRNLLRVELPGGGAATYTIDAAGRIEEVSLAGGDVRYEYEAGTDRLASVESPTGIRLAFGHDGDRVVSATWSGPVSGIVGKDLDDDGMLSSLSVNGADEVAYSHDADALVTAAGPLSITRSATEGRVVSTSLGSVEEDWEYNSFGEPTRVVVTRNGGTLFDFRCVRDALGRVIERQDGVAGATFTYAYSDAGRLTEVRRDGTPIETYTHDANGNRLTFHGEGGASATGAYDDQDRLLTYDGATYTYAPNGELDSRAEAAGTTTYDYDELGNLMRVALPDGTEIRYLVDGRNRRIGREVNGTLVQGFLYQDDLNPIAELDGSGDVVSRFVYATRANVPDYMVHGGRTYRIVSDLLGSPRLVIDVGDGTVAQRLDFDSFGRVIEDTNPGFQPFGFAGGLYDASTGLVRFGARDYDPKVGRFTAKDPIRFDGGTANLYEYAGGDPVNLIDSRGNIPWPAVALIAAFAYGVYDELDGLAGDIGDLVDVSLYADQRAQLDELYKSAGRTAEKASEALSLRGGRSPLSPDEIRQIRDRAEALQRECGLGEGLRGFVDSD